MATQNIKTFNPNDRFKNFGIGKSRKSTNPQQYSTGGFRSKYQSPNIEGMTSPGGMTSMIEGSKGRGLIAQNPSWYSNIGSKSNLGVHSTDETSAPWNPTWSGQGSTRIMARGGGYALPPLPLGFKLLPKHIQEKMLAERKAKLEAHKQNVQNVATAKGDRHSVQSTGTTNIARGGGFKGGTGSNFVGSKSKYQSPTVPYAQQPVPNVTANIVQETSDQAAIQGQTEIIGALTEEEALKLQEAEQQAMMDQHQIAQSGQGTMGAVKTGLDLYKKIQGPGTPPPPGVAPATEGGMYGYGEAPVGTGTGVDAAGNVVSTAPAAPSTPVGPAGTTSLTGEQVAGLEAGQGPMAQQTGVPTGSGAVELGTEAAAGVGAGPGGVPYAPAPLPIDPTLAPGAAGPVQPGMAAPAAPAAPGADAAVAGVSTASKAGTFLKSTGGAGLIMSGVGMGVSALANDDDPTTFTFGEGAGAALSGAGTALGIGSLLGVGGMSAAAPLAAMGPVGWAVLAAGALFSIGRGLWKRKKARKAEKKAKRKAKRLRAEYERKRQNAITARNYYQMQGQKYSGYNTGQNLIT